MVKPMNFFITHFVNSNKRAIPCFREVNDDNMVFKNISAEFLEDTVILVSKPPTCRIP